MTTVWLEVFLGRMGKYIIDFIYRYYYFIIPLVFAYAIFLAISSYNLKKIEKKANLEILNQAKNIIREVPDISYADLVERIEIPWEEIIKAYSFFPYISQESDLWISRTSILNVRDIIMHNDTKIKLVLERNGIYNFREKSAIHKNLYTEYIHRITRRK
jgi:putative heme iron utilization protein